MEIDGSELHVIVENTIKAEHKRIWEACESEATQFEEDVLTLNDLKRIIFGE